MTTAPSKPVIFSAPMVRALLAGEKTVTRRLNGLRDLNAAPDDWVADGKSRGAWQFHRKNEPTVLWAVKEVFSPGLELWVRETWRVHLCEGREMETIHYRADGESCSVDGRRLAPWRSPIHMPRRASRLTLRVTDCRLERLQAVTPQEVLAEGVRIPTSREGHALLNVSSPHAPVQFLHGDPRTASVNELLVAHFASLWDDLHGTGAWAKNPFVWVIRFESFQAS